ncbi:MAG: LytTR family transcriptional regulator DNA-binding domain-containing protein [Flavobacterium sp.]
MISIHLRFIWCSDRILRNKSYLILKDHIASYNSSTVLLKNGKELPIGRTYKNNLKI